MKQMGCLFVQVRFSSAQSAPPETISRTSDSPGIGVESVSKLSVKVSCVRCVLHASLRDVLPFAEAAMALPPADAALLAAQARGVFPSTQAVEEFLLVPALAGFLLIRAAEEFPVAPELAVARDSFPCFPHAAVAAAPSHLDREASSPRGGDVALDPE
jgi:hypothetical protein